MCSDSRKTHGKSHKTNLLFGENEEVGSYPSICLKKLAKEKVPCLGSRRNAYSHEGHQARVQARGYGSTWTLID